MDLTADEVTKLPVHLHLPPELRTAAEMSLQEWLRCSGHPAHAELLALKQRCQPLAEWLFSAGGGAGKPGDIIAQPRYPYARRSSRGAVASCGGEQLSCENAARLAPPTDDLTTDAWLSDTVINSYAVALAFAAGGAAVAARPARRRAVILSTDISAALQQVNDTEVLLERALQRTRTITDLLDHELVLLPINVGQEHWVLGVVDLAGRRLVLLDSMGW